MPSSCSFRITCTTEDLAETITAFSQRLVKLEQCQVALELELNKVKHEPTVEPIKILDCIDQFLKECQELLTDSVNNASELEKSWTE